MHVPVNGRLALICFHTTTNPGLQMVTKLDRMRFCDKKKNVHQLSP